MNSGQQSNEQPQQGDPSSTTSVIGSFNLTFLHLVNRLCELFPQEVRFSNLKGLVQHIILVDNENMMIAIDAWLRYFGVNVYSMVQAGDPGLWNSTTFFGIDMRGYWHHLSVNNINHIRELWAYIVVLVNTANILKQIPTPKIIQVNDVIKNTKQVMTEISPYLMEFIKDFPLISQLQGMLGGYAMQFLSGLQPGNKGGS